MYFCNNILVLDTHVLLLLEYSYHAWIPGTIQQWFRWMWYQRYFIIANLAFLFTKLKEAVKQRNKFFAFVPVQQSIFWEETSGTGLNGAEKSSFRLLVTILDKYIYIYEMHIIWEKRDSQNTSRTGCNLISALHVYTCVRFVSLGWQLWKQ